MIYSIYIICWEYIFRQEMLKSLALFYIFVIVNKSHGKTKNQKCISPSLSWLIYVLCSLARLPLLLSRTQQIYSFGKSTDVWVYQGCQSQQIMSVWRVSMWKLFKTLLLNQLWHRLWDKTTLMYLLCDGLLLWVNKLAIDDFLHCNQVK